MIRTIHLSHPFVDHLRLAPVKTFLSQNTPDYVLFWYRAIFRKRYL